MKRQVTTAVCAVMLGGAAFGAEDVMQLDAGVIALPGMVLEPEVAGSQGKSPEAAADGGFTLFGPSGKAYGRAGSKAWTIGGLYANDFQQASDVNLHVAWSNFLADDFEFGVEAAGWYFNQPGQDTGGVSGSMLFRWHAWHDEAYSWSVFVDAGIGLLGAFDDVPDGARSFGFLPRLGMGATFALGDNSSGQAARLMVGARWHHISNARIGGDSDNPSRDALAGYVAIVFPF